MLVLSRRRNEELILFDENNPDGEKIIVTVIRIKGNIVRIGIEAPANIRVCREEITEEVKDDLRADLITNTPKKD